MNADFPRILTLLRKEKGISQKEVAAKLGISQALLSHYEKGIRECGLSFVVKAADYYNVSCDYLLGRTAERQYDIAELSADAETVIHKRAVATVNIKQMNFFISASFSVIFFFGIP